MSNNFENGEIAITLEGRISRIMAEQGVGRHQAHIQACRELNLTEDGRGSGRLRRVAGLAVIGFFSLTLGLGTAAAQVLAGDRDDFPRTCQYDADGVYRCTEAVPGTAGDCPVDSPANPLCTPKG
jgi:hypothetical protein